MGFSGVKSKRSKGESMAQVIIRFGRRLLHELGNVGVIWPANKDRAERVERQFRSLTSEPNEAIGAYWRTVGGYIEYGMREVDNERRAARTED